jgi:hypothetical protein
MVFLVHLRIGKRTKESQVPNQLKRRDTGESLREEEQGEVERQNDTADVDCVGRIKDVKALHVAKDDELMTDVKQEIRFEQCGYWQEPFYDSSSFSHHWEY